MVVVIVGREILVTALRSFIEERGSDFSAQWSGKIKMVFQCLAASACLFYMYYANQQENAPQWCRVLLVVFGLVGGDFHGLFRRGVYSRGLSKVLALNRHK